MEKDDDEVSGQGNSYDFGARFYNNRIGRFLSLDPRYFEYPFYSPYSYGGNSPIVLVDDKGEGHIIVIYSPQQTAETEAAIKVGD